ncbi:HAMP domain-containing histidine kinase [Alteromonas mediterranea]|uniref:histidine kinase n=1 Tax=Alteromonas mediterranea TaxID=314275 RepID=A0AAC9JD02_9ALTE|nr:HAMP domain-containing sensor histidine kinase [Alteromonas mediterranea]APD91373.1 sensor histidine kinase [Alteromonas mediterranea]QDG36466.1 HAMP domain-containing histidine kinase [Alteromonas mediterranea]
MNEAIQRDIQAINAIEAIPHIMEILASTLRLRFICVARVTEEAWTMCSVLDNAEFGLSPGDELEIETTFCRTVRANRKEIVINHASADNEYRENPIPIMYGFESYFSYPLYDAKGEFFGTLCGLDPEPRELRTEAVHGQVSAFAKLISNQILLNDHIEQTHTQLSDAKNMARLQEQYIAILGHDIRTPLSSIQIGISFLDDVIKDSEIASTVQVPVFKAVSRMKNSVQRMSRLIEDTMDFTHTRVGQGLPVKLAVSNNLSQQINYTVEELAAAYPKSSIRIHVDITRPLICDDKRICQLLSNLLKNALIHGDLSYPVYVKVLTNSNDFILSVQNSGAPISDDSKARLFQPFWRKESNRQNEGLGLGLFIASEIAKAHKGTLGVNSDYNGTEFTLRFPLQTVSSNIFES